MIAILKDALTQKNYTAAEAYDEGHLFFVFLQMIKIIVITESNSVFIQFYSGVLHLFQSQDFLTMQRWLTPIVHFHN